MKPGRGSGTATVLFTDIVGSTDLMTQVGEAAFDELRRAHFAGLLAAIQGSGGEEIKNTGDGVMAVFGSVVDAIRCAVAIQQATDRQARSGPAPLAIRVGLSVGEVSFEDGDVFGTPVVEAARLVAAAAAGQILITAIARALAGGRVEAAFRDLGALELKGLPQPVQACEVAWEPLPEPSVPMPTLLTDVGRIFVGREAEQERLEQLWKEAAAGELRLVLLAGEPGVGKTRLAATLAAQSHRDGATVLAGRCDEDLGVPYQPFVEALRHLVEHAPPADLVARLGRYGGELVRLVPELGERLSQLAAPIRSDPETEQYRLFDAVAAWLASVSAETPVLLVLDDLQWAAKPTLLLLRHVARSPEPMRLLVLGTYRDTELSHNHPLVEVMADLRRQGGLERLPLSGLDQAGVAAVMEQAAGHALDEEAVLLARAIQTETEGNPFFVLEILRHLAETGAIERHEGRWGSRLPVEEIGIPEGVREVVGRRLSRLSGVGNRTLRVAAVVGPEFEVAVLQAAEGVDEEDVISAVEEASAAGLVIEAPGARYRFAHALVRDTLYDDLSAARKVALHRRVAEAIEVVHAGGLEAHLPALAHHYARASAPAAESAKAAAYARRAGDQALAQLAHDEAVTYYRQALEMLTLADGSFDEGERAGLLADLGEALRRAGDPAHRETLLEAARLAQRHGEVEALVRAALANTRGYHSSAVGVVDVERVAVLEAALEALGDEETARKAQLLATLGLEVMYGEGSRRMELSDEALALARRLGEPDTLALVLRARYNTIQAPGTLAERSANTAELLEIADNVDDPVTRALAWSLRYRALMEAGDVEGADHCLARFEEMTAALGQPTLRWMSGYLRCARVLLAGRIEEAEALAFETFSLGTATGQPDALTFFGPQLAGIRFEQGRTPEIEAQMIAVVERIPGARGALAFHYAELGRDDDARTWLDRAADGGFAALRQDHVWLSGVCGCTVAIASLDDRERAAELYPLLAPYAERLGGSALWWLGSVEHYLGMLATTLRHFDEAEARFVAAVAMHERIGAPSWLARTRLEWARMLLTRHQHGDAERARDLIGESLATARELGFANVERRAVALLR